jgi:ankyrin repeat protein
MQNLLYIIKYFAYTRLMKTLVVTAAICLTGASCMNPGPPLSPMIVAARQGDVGRIQELAAAKEDVNQRGGVNDWTPLMHAIHKNQAGSVKALLDAHADVSATAGRADALTMAAGYGYADIVQELLAHGAKPSPGAISAAVGGSTDIDRPTVGKCQTDTVKALLAIDPSLKSKVDFASLKVAQAAGCKEVVAMLE